jgi:hypothetical protein
VHRHDTPRHGQVLRLLAAADSGRFVGTSFDLDRLEKRPRTTLLFLPPHPLRPPRSRRSHPYSLPRRTWLRAPKKKYHTREPPRRASFSRSTPAALSLEHQLAIRTCAPLLRAGTEAPACASLLLLRRLFALCNFQTARSVVPNTFDCNIRTSAPNAHRST